MRDLLLLVGIQSMIYAAYLLHIPVAFQPSSIWFPWTLVSHGLIQASFPLFLLSSFFHIHSALFFLKKWGLRECLSFFLVVQIATALGFTAFCFVASLVQGSYIYMHYELFGMQGLVLAYLIAFKQIIPEHMVQVGSLSICRVKHFACLYLGSLWIAQSLTSDISTPVANTVSFLCAWTYLRFFKIYHVGRTSIQGDRSAAFSIASFFPRHMRSWLNPVSRGIDAVLETVVGKSKVFVSNKSPLSPYPVLT